MAQSDRHAPVLGQPLADGESTIMTARGMYCKDPSGLWHYRYPTNGYIQDAVADALDHRIMPAWFWFNGTPAPMYAGDNAVTLMHRWWLWRNDYEANPRRLLDRIRPAAFAR